MKVLVASAVECVNVVYKNTSVTRDSILTTVYGSEL
jgi:hypothetical protein